MFLRENKLSKSKFTYKIKKYTFAVLFPNAIFVKLNYFISIKIWYNHNGGSNLENQLTPRQTFGNVSENQPRAHDMSSVINNLYTQSDSIIESITCQSAIQPGSHKTARPLCHTRTRGYRVVEQFWRLLQKNPLWLIWAKATMHTCNQPRDTGTYPEGWTSCSQSQFVLLPTHKSLERSNDLPANITKAVTINAFNNRLDRDKHWNDEPSKFNPRSTTWGHWG